MRLLLTILIILSQTACTALLLGGGKSGEYPAGEDPGQTQKDCKEYPDQAHCK